MAPQLQHQLPPPLPPCHRRACPRSLPERTGQMLCRYRGPRSPQSPSSACSPWKASDFWWPDVPSLPSMSQTAACWHQNSGWGRPCTAAQSTYKGTAERPVEHRPLHPKPSAITPPLGTGTGWAPRRTPAGAPPNRRRGPGWAHEGPTVHTSKEGGTGACKASGK